MNLISFYILFSKLACSFQIYLYHGSRNFPLWVLHSKGEMPDSQYFFFLSDTSCVARAACFVVLSHEQ